MRSVTLWPTTPLSQVQVQPLFQDETASWIRIVNGIAKFVKEAMPIQEEEKTSGIPLQKRDQY